ncbi:hydroxymethylpyrimidine/phosphomethylpyrimidine kinase [Natronocella acetinitrilica]|uniref:hydroxymethylpyrimidine kinase n=1 Tax=Natronocella acetinitrilica TaxID=414046 RepID=A0AAE3G5Y3_9GAMM|nr:bifunctional hydroxymethylpyrimidine kinase/phosphomethylpyrimidine kinase [Natronocella acetinitrilica]MCP1676254.1 hydroxymethylpyrimidine/phosphomethylpyrimidine kinase [Natronocella acetinitrilica]
MQVSGRVLIIAGSDSGGGAGIQADIKAVSGLGGYAMTALTALTAQNTQGVTAIHAVPADFIREQIRVVVDDLGVDAIKTGMLHDAAVIDAVVDTLDACARDVPLVVDPVMIAQSGANLLERSAIVALRERLLPRATLLTPNLPEAEALLDRTVSGAAAMEEAAMALSDMTGGSILLKGGHLPGEDLLDVLVHEGIAHSFHHQRIATRHTHGTGCTLASAIATGLAQGLTLDAAVARGRRYLLTAIRTAPGLGGGDGPVNHAHTLAREAVERGAAD